MASNKQPNGIIYIFITARANLLVSLIQCSEQKPGLLNTRHSLFWTSLASKMSVMGPRVINPLKPLAIFSRASRRKRLDRDLMRQSIFRSRCHAEYRIFERLNVRQPRDKNAGSQFRRQFSCAINQVRCGQDV